MQPTQFTSETWKPIVGHEGSYEVSNFGKVRSLDRVSIRKDGSRLSIRGRIMARDIDSQGYSRVHLSREGKRRAHFVHRLVLEAFVGPCPEGLETRHLDGDNSNNLLENLSYGTGRQNTLDKVKHGTHLQASRRVCPRGHKLADPNLVAAQKRRGNRSCLACSRANSYLLRHPELRGDQQAIADSYHSRIISEADA